MTNSAERKWVTKRWLLNSFWLSIFLHLLLLISFSTVIIYQPEKKKKTPNLYVPSYVYKGAMTPLAQQQRMDNTRNLQHAQKVIPATKNGIQHKSMLAATLSML